MHIDYTGAGRDVLARALARAPEHLQSPFRAVRDEGCGFIIVSQSRNAFTIPANRPYIVLIGDDLDAAMGPAGFHVASLRTAIAECYGAAVIASEPVVDLYHEAASIAVLKRRNALIVETRPCQQKAWMDLIKEIQPNIGMALATVLGHEPR